MLGVGVAVAEGELTGVGEAVALALGWGVAGLGSRIFGVGTKKSTNADTAKPATPIAAGAARLVKGSSAFR